MMSLICMCHRSIVASVPACHADDLDSITGSDIIFSFNLLYKVEASITNEIRESAYV